MDYELMERALSQMKEAQGVDFVYYEFQGRPTTESYIAYIEAEKSTFSADNKVYYYEFNFVIELYTPEKLPELERALIEILDDHEIYWQQGPQGRIKSEDMYLTTFYV